MAASSSSAVPTKELRYLLVSNGYVISLLDLKQINNEEEPLRKPGDFPPLPIIATLNLIEKGHPVLPSLFKLRSNVYIVGGEKRDAIVDYRWPMRVPFNAASCENFRISLAPDGTLSAAEGIKSMKFPKIWPIVEETDDEVHVFDSAPYMGAFPNCDWVFTHETLDEVKKSKSGNRCVWRWRKIRTKESDIEWFINSHVVVGDCIFARAGGENWYFVMKDRYWNKHYPWEFPLDDIRRINKYSAQTVWEIMTLGGDARCALKAPNGLFVVIALVHNGAGAHENVVNVTAAVAYLVRANGDIVCKQPLHHFFDDSVQPIEMDMCRVMKADEEGNTICTIVVGGALFKGIPDDIADDIADDEYVFINTFTVKLLTSFDFFQFKSERPPITSLLIRGGDVFREFVSVDIKERYIFKPDEPGALSKNLQACFM